MTLEEFDDAYEHTNETPIKRARLSEDEHGYDQGRKCSADDRSSPTWRALENDL